jgi:hypothetical protein
MAIDVFQKQWSVEPPVSARAVQGHPLCPRHGFLVNGGAIVDVARGVVAQPDVSAGLWTPGSVRGYATKTREHTTGGNFDRLGPTAVLYPLQEVTIVMGYEKTDGTFRVSAAFGQETNAGGTGAGNSRVSSHLPFSDGTVYWDFGGDSGGNRLSVGGLSFGDDIWCFTTGPRGMEIFQNGLLRASNGSNSTRSDQADTATLGKLASSGSDLAKYKFFYIYWRQLTTDEIREITRSPFCWVDPRP